MNEVFSLQCCEVLLSGRGICQRDPLAEAKALRFDRVALNLLGKEELTRPYPT